MGGGLGAVWGLMVEEEEEEEVGDRGCGLGLSIS